GLEPCRSRLEAGHEPIRYPLRGSIRSTIRVNLYPALNTEILTLPQQIAANARCYRIGGDIIFTTTQSTTFFRQK
ncbi:hypothetical protein, partial [Ralstonia solanacearum]|uniref:hypothetical protein n=1 Tax=Ralstonia solanacearum TaxID=305 RepID=UPI001C12CAB3